MDAYRTKEARLTGLYEEYYDKIAHYAFARTGDKTEAEDIASEVFLKALDSLDSYQERGLPMQAWLFKIAHNLVVDRLIKKTRQKTIPLDNVEIPEEDDPASTAEKNIEIQRMTQAMHGLTNDQQEVLRLRFFGGLASKEVAALMKKNDGAVREMQRAALEKLRQIMDGGNARK
jgi:RNA polymerase sigma-70 factor, ECF subfamily